MLFLQYRGVPTIFFVNRDKKHAAVMVPASRPPILAMSAKFESKSSDMVLDRKSPAGIAGILAELI